MHGNLSIERPNRFRLARGSSPKVKLTYASGVTQIITQSDEQYLVYNFDLYDKNNQYSQYTHGNKFYAINKSGTKDITKIEFGAGDISVGGGLFGGTIYGNHALNLGNKVEFTAEHGKTAANIGDLLTRNTDGKKFVIYGIFDSKTLYVLGEAVYATYCYADCYRLNLDVGNQLDSLTIKAVSIVQIQCAMKQTHTVDLFKNGTLQRISADKTDTGDYAVITNLAKHIHPYSMYEFLRDNVGHLGHIVSDMVTQDTFYDPIRGTVKEIQRKETKYTIRNDGWIVEDDTWISVVADGGIDCDMIWQYCITDRQGTNSWSYLPKTQQTIDSHSLYHPSSKKVSAYNHTTMDQQIYLYAPDGVPAHSGYAIIEDEFNASGKASYPNRFAILDDNNFGSFNVILDCLDNSYITRAMRHYDFGDGIALSQKLGNKILLNDTLSGSRHNQTVRHLKKLTTNHTDGFTIREHINLGTYGYIWLDIHQSLPEGYIYKFPSEFNNWDCEIVEKTNSLTINTVDTSKVIASGFSMDYSYDEDTAPYAFVVFKVFVHVDDVMDTDAVNLIARMTTKPTSERELIIDRFFKDLKTYNVYNKIDALWTVGHDTVESRKNIKGDIYNLVQNAYGLPTFETDRGWTGGAAKGFVTNYNPGGDALQYKSKSCSLFFYLRSAPVGSTIPMGIYDGGSPNYLCVGIIPRFTGNYIKVYPNHYLSKQKPTAETVRIGQGFYSMTIHNDVLYLYKDGILICTFKGVTPMPLTSKVLELLFVTTIGTFSGQLSLAGIGDEMTSTQHAHLFLAVNQYLQSIGATV